MAEELGATCSLEFCTSFIYRVNVGGGLEEHELDHLFVGRTDGPFSPNPDEVASIEWWETDHIIQSLKKTPERFTPWFPLIVEKVKIR